MYCRKSGRCRGGRQYPTTAERCRAAANLRPALAGQSCRQLTATFGLTKSTVGRWLQELREDCPTRVAGSAEIIAHAVARYDALYRKALEPWHLSQADKETESVVEIETARGPKKKRTRRTSQCGTDRKMYGRKIRKKKGRSCELNLPTVHLPVIIRRGTPTKD